MKSSVPLSAHAEEKRKEAGAGMGLFFSWLFAAFFTVVFIVVVETRQWTLAVCINVLAVAVTLLLLRQKRRRIAKVLEENRMDLLRSQALVAVLDRFRIAPEDKGVVEPDLGTWTVFEVQSAPTVQIAAEYSGRFKGYGGGLFGGPISGTMQGRIKGEGMPDLMEESYVLRLTDGSRTLRVILWHPSVVRRMFASKIDTALGFLTSETHTYAALRAFRNNVDPSATHPQLIDGLKFACLPDQQRVQVSVAGTRVQEGVVIGSSISVGGKNNVFLPSGYFKALMTGLSEEFPRLKEAS